MKSHCKRPFSQRVSQFLILFELSIQYEDEIKIYREQIEKRNKYKRLLKDVNTKIRYLKSVLNVRQP